MTALNIAPASVSAGGYDIAADVLAGIRKASSETGVDFGYLMAQAAKESSFNPTAKSGSSSAAGLYQFVEQTWLSVVRKHGAEHGLGDLADKIKFADGGGFRVADPSLRKQILDLRRDPEIAAIMAAEHAADNKAILEQKLKRPIDSTDLYLAHFLGVSGAQKFLRALDKDPNSAANEIFGRAAQANPSVFYRQDGSARSVREVYDRFDQRLDTDIALFDDLEQEGIEPNVRPANLELPQFAYAVKKKSAGLTHPASALSPATIVALASLPVAREGTTEDTGQRRSLFEGSLFVKPLV